MANLTNKYIYETFPSLVGIGTSGTSGVTGTPQVLTDGKGVELPMKVSTTEVEITGDTITQNLIIEGYGQVINSNGEWTGAGGGTGEDMARETVGGVTAQDIRTGADTQKENQTSLDSSLSSFLTELQRKRRANDDVLVNNERAVRRDTNTQLQDLFGKMAGYYGSAEMEPQRNEWMNRAGALTPEIAANSRTQVGNYDTAPVTVKAPELTAFSGPTQPDVIAGDSAERGRVGSGIFTISDQRRRREQAPVGV